MCEEPKQYCMDAMLHKWARTLLSRSPSMILIVQSMLSKTKTKTSKHQVSLQAMRWASLKTILVKLCKSLASNLRAQMLLQTTNHKGYSDLRCIDLLNQSISDIQQGGSVGFDCNTYYTELMAFLKVLQSYPMVRVAFAHRTQPKPVNLNPFIPV